MIRNTLLVLGLASVAFSWNPRPLIVGGVEATPGEFPFMVSLRASPTGSHFCGGSLIAPNWVLTAAHCMISSFPTRGVVAIGLHKRTETPVELLKVKRVIKHPLYQSVNSFDHDYALVELDGSSKFDPIDLEPALDGLEGASAVTAGWGTLVEGGPASQVLMKVFVPIRTEAECSAAYPGDITDTMICAGLDEGGKDSCQGDSGGPLFVEMADGSQVLVGVVSWGYGCARPEKYGVYSKVSAALEWIRESMKPLPEPSPAPSPSPTP